MPTYTKLSTGTYTLMLNKESDWYEYMHKILTTLMYSDNPLSYYQLEYRIKTSGIKRALDILERSGCIILILGKYRITDKGIALLPLLNAMLEKWNE